MGALYRVVLGEVAFHFAMITLMHSNKEPDEAYILTRQMRTVLYPYQNLGLFSPGGVISHHHITLASLLPSLFNVPML